MSLRVSHTCKIYLRRNYVDVTLVSKSCSFHPLHGLAISDVTKSRFSSRDLGNSSQAHSFALFKMTSRVSHARKVYLREKCVDVRLLPISCNFLPLYRLAYSDLPKPQF